MEQKNRGYDNQTNKKSKFIFTFYKKILTNGGLPTINSDRFFRAFFIKRVLVTGVGASSSGKTPDFGSGIRRFESFCPSHL